MTTQTPQKMAPGHVHLPQQGTGIAWTPEMVILHIRGEAPITAPHTTKTPWDFWYNLAFLTAFPQVTHWWFRSIWTGRVRLTRPGTETLAPGTVYGFVEWDVTESDRGMYTVTEGDPLVIDVPYPPNETQPANLPLRVQLARLVVALLQDEAQPSNWYGVSSLIPASELAAALPITIQAERQLYGNWRLAYGEGQTPFTLRETLCRVMGLEPPAA